MGRSIPLPYTCRVPPSSQGHPRGPPTVGGRPGEGLSPPRRAHLRAGPACGGTASPQSRRRSCAGAESSQGFASAPLLLSPSEPKDVLKTRLSCPAKALLPHTSTLFLSISLFSQSSLFAVVLCVFPCLCVNFSARARCRFIWVFPPLRSPLGCCPSFLLVSGSPSLNRSPWWP